VNSIFFIIYKKFIAASLDIKTADCLDDEREKRCQEGGTKGGESPRGVPGERDIYSCAVYDAPACIAAGVDERKREISPARNKKKF
jgi:hypothetical protein